MVDPREDGGKARGIWQTIILYILEYESNINTMTNEGVIETHILEKHINVVSISSFKCITKCWRLQSAAMSQ